MRDLLALAYEISQTTETEQKYKKAFCKALKDEILHTKDAELAEILSCTADTKNKEYVVTLRIKFSSDEINTACS